MVTEFCAVLVSFTSIRTAPAASRPTWISPAAAPANVTQVANWQRGPAWKCSDKQKDLILKLVAEHQLDKASVEALAIERFNKGVRQLSKLEASGLIDELLDTHGGGSRPAERGSNRRNGSAYNGAAASRRKGTPHDRDPERSPAKRRSPPG